jgi:inorganic pyrophosphatase
MFSTAARHSAAQAAGLVDTSQFTDEQLQRLSTSQHALWLARANAFKQLEEAGMSLDAKGRKEILDGFRDKKAAKDELRRAHDQLKDSLAAKTL